jgi:2-oxoglutarate dehydrogenase E1 component
MIMSDLATFFGPNAGYVLELYDRFRQDPLSVDPETRAFFEGWSPGENQEPRTKNQGPRTEGQGLRAEDGAAPSTNREAAAGTPSSLVVGPSSVPAGVDLSRAHTATRSPLDVTHTVAAARLIRYIRELGHLGARIDPLGSEPPGDPGLELATHDVSEADLALLPADIVRGPLVEGSATALEAVARLRAVYSGPIGYETDHIQVYEERTWLRDAIESNKFFYSMDEPARRRDLLERLTEVETFERFLHQTFVGQKRFSIEGNDMLVPMLDSIIRNAAAGGVQEVVIGMAHRGRLNVLAHILGKPYAQILGEFINASRNGQSDAGRGAPGWVGDVKYHLGARKAYKDSGIEGMPITLAPNPSHLEFVDPVVEGRARAAQERRDQRGAPQRDKRGSLPILIHGDAAFPGQGIVAETLNISNIGGYRTGGTIHIITNNQIGFTTEPSESRSTLYASDLAKGFEIPIVHVNADDVAACIAVARMAYAYREQFGKDFLIDLVGYRRWGHNEGDEPAFTQPLMYAQIAKHPTVRAQWAGRLEQDGVIQPGEGDRLVEAVTAQLQQARAEAEAAPHTNEPPPPPPPGLARRTLTAVSAERLRALNEQLMARPEGFVINSRLERTLERRKTALDTPGAIDWAHAEALAFASLLEEGVPVRLSGQDSERGTFSHRHAVLREANTGTRYCSLQHLEAAKASFAVYNSPLSEAGVLGFEFGYSAHAPNVLVLWEAQFGDFANGAQVIIDQFIVSAHKKWGQTPNLVLLLPHGYEGQGPEHSSARLERFLQLAADDNIRVANCTTAAQYFHLLRRQALLLNTDPRPLVIMTPKSLLRHPRAGSSLADLAEGRFQRVIDDPAARERAAEVTRLVLCSGKVYVDLMAVPEAGAVPSVAVVRVEELYSFPADELREVVAGYPNLREVVWLQEEPQNQGAWHYMERRLRALLDPALELSYSGRAPSASPAEGSLALHTVEQARIIQEALHGHLQHAAAR